MAGTVFQPVPSQPGELAVAVDVPLPSDWSVSERQLCDLEMILTGAFAPLKGFMGIEDYKSVVEHMTLSDGSIFPLPVVLAIPKRHCGIVAETNVCWMPHQKTEDKVVALRDNVGTVIAKLRVESVYEPNLSMEMQHVLGTTHPNHPYVKYLLENHSDCYYLGGSLEPCAGVVRFNFEQYRLTPAVTQDLLRRRQQQEKRPLKVVGFQTRNPIHRCHYELIKRAVKQVETESGESPLLLLSPVVGPTQPGDVPYHIRVRCYEHIIRIFDAEAAASFSFGGTALQNAPTLPGTPTSDSAVESRKWRSLLVLIPLAMRMAGPRECVLHAIIRKNYGCSHFIVGRDHAGPSTRKPDGSPFYAPYDAHQLLASVADKIGITPVFGEEMLFVASKQSPSFAPPDSVEAENGSFVSASEWKEMQTQGEEKSGQRFEVQTLSGTEFRRRLTQRACIPEWFSFRSVVTELQRFFKPNHERGVCVYFTGLPCSGKSTLANALEASLLATRGEDRQITLLDADVVRQHLSKGLGFSREDRSTNVRRIGYLASEIAKHGGMCLVANIAPYKSDRQYNRELIESVGGAYIEVYVSTPLSVCEGRDVKHLYKKAREGVIKQFTGISDPYEPPEDAELTIDSSRDIQGKAAIVMEYLKEKGFVREIPMELQEQKKMTA